ncbi:MAG: TlpA family protein disulfide reductase [Tessaracoccus sp.]|uniref:TlpA family protein disulfide reductase n=1 Tax=Tessaracoccus sp. TaxID=1971211 RepID=UPI001EC2A00C|nr:TlpA disulfide reductase family protein [Tessaracoccus sp.]MBK7822626.1 TlpA family protein disulfide reductase [Tessaracoccus sp.]
MRRLAVAVAAALSLVGCSAAPGASEGLGFTTGDGTVAIVPVAERQEAPVLAGTTLAGEEVSTADFAGTPIVINVWGSWCAPCREEAPQLVEAAKQLGDDAVFLGLNTRDLDAGPALAFERAFEVTYPSIFDPDGELLLGFGQLPPKAIPSTIVIDADGRVAARVIGQVDAKTLVGIVGDVEAGS